MKQLFTFLAIAALTSSLTAQNSVPNVVIKDLEGNNVNTGDLENDGNPIVICFWATWCSPCKRELNAYQEYYEEWQEETGVKIIAVTIDDQRSVSRVGPYISSVEWEYEIWLDSNKQFARAMGVNNVPHTFLIDADGKIVWQHNNYAPGDEEELHEQLLLLAK